MATARPPRVYIHLGPHKTGSTSIQQFLTLNRDRLAADFGLAVLRDARTSRAARKLARGQLGAARAALAEARADAPPGLDLVLSHEDFAGCLPGRWGVTQIYPTLARHVALLARAFPEREAVFVFVERPPESWLLSCYLQNIQHRDDYASFAAFTADVGDTVDWDGVTAGARRAMPGRFLRLPYLPEQAAHLASFLGALGIEAGPGAFRQPQPRNVTRHDLRPLMEAINAAPLPPERKRELKALAHSRLSLTDFAARIGNAGGAPAREDRRASAE